MERLDRHLTSEGCNTLSRKGVCIELIPQIQPTEILNSSYSYQGLSFTIIDILIAFVGCIIIIVHVNLKSVFMLHSIA